MKKRTEKKFQQGFLNGKGCHVRLHTEQPTNMAADYNSQNQELPTNMATEDYGI